MDTVCQAAFNLMTSSEARKAEAVLREYLLRVSDQVRMSRIDSSYLSLYHIIPHPFRIKKFRSMLGGGDIASEDNDGIVFNLTDNIKRLLNQKTLFFTGPRSIFYGLTDPKFLQKDNEIGYYLVSDKILTLHISDSDKAELASKGIYMDSPQI